MAEIGNLGEMIAEDSFRQVETVIMIAIGTGGTGVDHLEEDEMIGNEMTEIVKGVEGTAGMAKVAETGNEIIDLVDDMIERVEWMIRRWGDIARENEDRIEVCQVLEALI